MTHFLFQCCDPYYIWHQFRITFGTLFTFTTSYYEFIFCKLRNEDINAKIIAVKDSTAEAETIQVSNADLWDSAAARIQLE